MSQLRKGKTTSREYNYAVWGTQGGGLAREVRRGVYIFVTKPNCPGFDVGDEVPAEWGLTPANEIARQEMGDEELGDLEIF